VSEEEIDRSPDTRRAEYSKVSVVRCDRCGELCFHGIEAWAARHLDCVPRLGGRATEYYLMVTVDIPGGTLTAGLQRSPGEPLPIIRAELRRVTTDAALILNGDSITDDTAAPLIDAVAARLTATWPDRAWFLEVWDAVEELAQTYSPFGRPRHQSTSPAPGG
jgi:hypothetical protein